MLEDRIVYVNGEYVPWNQATIHLMSHSVGRGSAIYEVMSLHHTADGPAIFRLDAHAERFFKTAELLHMQLPLSPREFQDAVMETVRRNGLKEGLIKTIAFYSQLSWGVVPADTTLGLSLFALNPKEELGGLTFPSDEGATLAISKWRKLDPETVPVEAKVAAHYINGMMARKEAADRGFEFTLLLDTQGFLAEGSTESIFLVKDGTLMTPSLGTILDSITRKSVLEAAPALGLEIREERIPPETLYEAEEIFLSGTPMKVLPVKKVEDRVIEGTPGPVTRTLASLLKDIVAGKDERFKEWLFPIT
ncbi:MAG: branched-chain-amino-acid transaminase [Deltaproteobacteria bacterium]|nr:branched-chain-amino-acid transaminase [Deltaproteobacteria bacterium]